ncbi:MAG: TonB-dependent receptor plug domain-containing protein [Bacteroidales bacterium]|nr:TonB-dependent receptor plug domain-containing protein [Bacteroidales bacterium]MBN2821456.1 TonB-dependent receptor plug domain-containing protein [Bacteroidales bacterium]
MKRTKWLIILLFLSFLLPAQQGVQGPFETIKKGAEWYNENRPKQKVYLHIDKDTYQTGEYIWMKAYIFSGDLPGLDTISQNLYIEVWSPSRIRADIFRVKINEGYAEASFELLDSLEQGIYQLRAFTDLMTRENPGFFYSQNLSVYNPKHSYNISSQTARKNRSKLRKIQKEKKKLFVELFISSSKPVAGISNEVFYRASNPFGEPIDVTAKIKKTDGKKYLLLGESRHGYGSFKYTPLENEKHKVSFIAADGEKWTGTLPPAEKEGLLSEIQQTKDSIILSIQKPYIISNDPSANRYYIIAFANNRIYYSGMTDLRDKSDISFSKEQFPDGIIQFAVLSNRLELETKISTLKLPEILPTVSINSRMTSDSVFIEIRKEHGVELKNASLSVITSNNEYNPDRYNFYEDYFFNSELDNFCLDALPFEELFSDSLNELIVRAGNLSEPDWDIIAGEFSDAPGLRPENGIEVKGQVVSEILSIPVRKAKVTLEVKDRYNDVYEIETGDDGRFHFVGFNFYDTLQMKIIARKSSGRKGVLINLEGDKTPKLTEYYGDFFLTEKSLRDNKAYRIEQNKKARKEMLEKERELNAYYATQIHGRPDFILYGEEVPSDMTVLDAMRGRVAGVAITGNNIIIRGISTILGSTDPLVLVDDVPTDVSVLNQIMMNDVDRVEILKGPSTTAYGVRGGNGVIAVYTKRGMYMTHGEIEFTLFGYQRKRNFFINNSVNIMQTGLPRTLLWIPEFNFSDNEMVKISFSKGITGEKLVLKLEGVKSDGSPFSQSFETGLN